MDKEKMLHELVVKNFSLFEKDKDIDNTNNTKENLEYINYFARKYYNFVTDNKIRSIRMNTLKNLLEKNKILFKINNVLISTWYVEEIELL